jgi:hypothetical protein
VYGLRHTTYRMPRCVFFAFSWHRQQAIRASACARHLLFSQMCAHETPQHRWYPQRNYSVRFVATTTDDPVYRLFHNFVCFPIDGLCSTVSAWSLNFLYLLAPCFIYACTWASLMGRPSVARAVWKTAATNITTFDVVLSHRFHFRCEPPQAIVIGARAHIAVNSVIGSSLAIFWSRNVLDRLSPLSVLTVEFPVHRQVRSASILASVVSI